MRQNLRIFSIWLLATVCVLLPAITAYLNRASALLFGLGVLAALLYRPERSRVIRLVREFLPMVAFVLWGALSSLWEATPDLALPQACQLLGLLVGGTLILAMVEEVNAQERGRLLTAIWIGLGLGLVIMLFDWATSCQILLRVQSLRNKLGSNGCWLPYLKTGPAVLVIMLPFVWRSIWDSFTWKGAVLGVALTVALLALAKVTESHAAVLALAMGGVVCLGAFVLGARKVAPVIALVLAGLLLGTPTIVGHFPPAKDLAEQYSWVPNSTRHRVIIWQFARKLIDQKPILGWGLNGARAVPGGKDSAEVWNKTDSGQIVMAMEPRMPLHPHNAALQIRLETGLVGSILAVLALGGLVWRMTNPFLLAQAGAAMVVAMVSFGVWQAWWLAFLWFLAVFNRIYVRTGCTKLNPAL